MSFPDLDAYTERKAQLTESIAAGEAKLARAKRKRGDSPTTPARELMKKMGQQETEEQRRAAAHMKVSKAAATKKIEQNI